MRYIPQLAALALFVVPDAIAQLRGQEIKNKGTIRLDGAVHRIPDTPSAFTFDPDGRGLTLVTRGSAGKWLPIRRDEVERFWGREGGIILRTEGCTA